MRLALISYEFPPETLGGIATYARHAVAMLAARGHDVTVFAGTAAATPRDESWHGARVRRLPCADRKNFATMAVPALAAEHTAASFDVAEIPDLYAEGRGLRALLPNLPIVMHAHTPYYVPAGIDFLALPRFARYLSGLRRLIGGCTHRQPLGQVWREACARVALDHFCDPRHDPERQVAFEADIVAVPSRRLAQRLLTDWGLPAERLRILPYSHSPDPELLALPPSTARRTVAFHGSVRYFKGVHVLAAAMPLVFARHPGVHFTLAGASGMSPVPDLSPRAWWEDQMVGWRDTVEWLRPQFAALGNRVTMRGFVSPENLVTHLSEADVCVFPSLFDNFPSACLEAMSAARPIVATRSGGMEEMLGDDDAGLLVAPGDSRALADSICRLLEDEPLRLRLARRARERVLSEYSPTVIAPRHEALYADAISRRRAAAFPSR